MGGVDVREEMAALADQVWRGEEAREKLHRLIRENLRSIERPDNPGPTEVAQITDYLYRPEHVSRIAHADPKDAKRRKRRRVAAAES
jgi:hypothetical protein